jgi:GNAT superfamily N-acetyltransferase
MEIKLEKAVISDAKEIFEIQVETFTPLLKKYEDYNTNPANQTIDDIIERINDIDEEENNIFYKIMLGNNMVGAISVWQRKNTTEFNIGIVFVHPKYQGNGLAQKALTEVENSFEQATCWKLNTILEEKKNCYLYEKSGYTKDGENIKLNDKTTLIFYKKEKQKYT